MARLTEVYYGDGFDYCQDHPWDIVLIWLAEGSVVERRMPTPTRKNPDKYRTVYMWIGEKMQELRDLSAEMPPSVTELAAQGSYIHRMMAVAWYGMRNYPVIRPSDIRPVTYEDVPLDRDHGLETPVFA